MRPRHQGSKSDIVLFTAVKTQGVLQLRIPNTEASAEAFKSFSAQT